MSGSFQAGFRSSLSRLDASDSWYDNRQPRADQGQRVQGNRVRYNDFVHQRHNGQAMMQSSVSLRSSLRSAEGIGNRMSNSASGFNNASDHSNDNWFLGKNNDNVNNNGDNSMKANKRGSNSPSEGYFCYGWKTRGPLSSRSKPKPYLGWRRSLGNLDETDNTRNDLDNGIGNNMNGNNDANHKGLTPAERLASSTVGDNSAKELREVSNVIVDYFANNNMAESKTNNNNNMAESKTNNRCSRRRVWLESSFLSTKT